LPEAFGSLGRGAPWIGGVFEHSLGSQQQILQDARADPYLAHGLLITKQVPKPGLAIMARTPGVHTGTSAADNREHNPIPYAKRDTTKRVYNRENDHPHNYEQHGQYQKERYSRKQDKENQSIQGRIPFADRGPLYSAPVDPA
jgi:hypothetical protein